MLHSLRGTCFPLRRSRPLPRTSIVNGPWTRDVKTAQGMDFQRRSRYLKIRSVDRCPLRVTRYGVPGFSVRRNVGDMRAPSGRSCGSSGRGLIPGEIPIVESSSTIDAAPAVVFIIGWREEATANRTGTIGHDWASSENRTVRAVGVRTYFGVTRGQSLMSR